jgi:hypothetical protein
LRFSAAQINRNPCRWAIILVTTELCCWQKEGKKGRNNNDYLLSRVTAALLKDGIVTDVIAEGSVAISFEMSFFAQK